ncbi:MAG: PAS domain S-box protein [Alphaproteobacteria bacterium]|nr:PAS domain S-box protein [Alphaproteobacteria bacterium]
MQPLRLRLRPTLAGWRGLAVIFLSMAAALSGAFLLTLILNGGALGWPWTMRALLGLASIGILAGSAAAAGWLVLSGRHAQSFERLTQAAQRMTRGATIVQIGPDYAQGEVGIVERAFDAMVETTVHQKTEIEESRQILEEVVSSLGEGLALYDPDGRFIFCNPRYYELFPSVRDLLVPGVWIDDILGTYVERTAAGESPESRADTAAALLAGFHEREKNQVRRHGGLWLRSSHFITANGGTVVAVADVSERVRRELDLLEAIDELRLSEDRFRALAETVPAGIYRMDSSGLLVFANEVWRRITGLTNEAEAATSWRAAVHPEDAGRIAKAWIEAVQHGRELRQEYRIRRPDGDVRLVADTAAPELDRDGDLVGFVGTLTDVTETREIEARLETTRRLEALGQLSGGVAHDFNNLLMIILGNAEMLEDMAARGEIETERLQRMARTILSTAERGTKLTQSMLGFARRRSVQPEKVAVHSRLKAIGALLTRNLGGKIELEFDLAAPRDHVMIDPAQLENAAINIALNARDAMTDGGRIVISTRILTLAQEEAAKRDLAPGDYLAIAIADTGAGMTQEVAARAVEPFFTTKRDKKAAGLGLSLVYGAVKQAGGELRIDTEVGRGTTVTFMLPLVSESDDALSGRSNGSTKAAASALARLRVLVIDDDAPVLSVMTAQLRRLGCETVGASSAEDALDVLETDPRFDLMLSDIDLGAGRDGYALAREVRLLRPDLKVLLTTGRLVERSEDGSPPVLPKPFTQHELEEKLREVLGPG